MPTSQTAGPRPAAGARRRVWRTSRTLGALLLAAGLACLGWFGYQLFGTDVVARRTYDRETSALRSQWRTTPEQSARATPPTGPTETPAEARPVPGSAIALLRVPRFGATYEVPVVAGTAATDLSRGVGHYDGTALPGALGNFAIAGHRVTHGQPFAELLSLQPGDHVVVETRAAVFTYAIDTAPRDLTVPDTAGWVLDPVPDRPGEQPSRALITLTTCQDLFRSPDRSVGFGHLVSTQPK